MQHLPYLSVRPQHPLKLFKKIYVSLWIRQTERRFHVKMLCWVDRFNIDLNHNNLFISKTYFQITDLTDGTVGYGQCVAVNGSGQVMCLPLLDCYYLSFHRLNEWQEELSSANLDISSETLDTQAANWDLSLKLKAEQWILWCWPNKYTFVNVF